MNWIVSEYMEFIFYSNKYNSLNSLILPTISIPSALISACITRWPPSSLPIPMDMRDWILRCFSIQRAAMLLSRQVLFHGVAALALAMLSRIKMVALRLRSGWQVELVFWGLFLSNGNILRKGRTSKTILARRSQKKASEKKSFSFRLKEKNLVALCKKVLGVRC